MPRLGSRDSAMHYREGMVAPQSGFICTSGFCCRLELDQVLIDRRNRVAGASRHGRAVQLCANASPRAKFAQASREAVTGIEDILSDGARMK